MTFRQLTRYALILFSVEAVSQFVQHDRFWIVTLINSLLLLALYIMTAAYKRSH